MRLGSDVVKMLLETIRAFKSRMRQPMLVCRKPVAVVASIWLLVVAGESCGGWTFQGLGFLPGGPSSEADGVSADGSKVLVMTGGGWGIVDPAPGQSIKTPLRTADMVAPVDPRAEWRQLFDDVWRFQRDYFYVENVHGLGANYYGFEASAAPGVNPKLANGYNIEGLAMAPGSSGLLSSTLHSNRSAVPVLLTW